MTPLGQVIFGGLAVALGAWAAWYLLYGDRGDGG
jgi:hypothetical protein